MHGIVHYKLLSQETIITGKVLASQLQKSLTTNKPKTSCHSESQRHHAPLRQRVTAYRSSSEAETIYPRLGIITSSTIFARHIAYILSSFPFIRKYKRTHSKEEVNAELQNFLPQNVKNFI